MKLENQVCTLEQAKRLKELGVTHEPFFTWLECAEFDDEGSKILRWVPVLFYEQGMDLYAVPGDYSENVKEEHGDFHETRGNYPAFTVAELGVMLPAWHLTFPRSTGSFGCYRAEKGEFIAIGERGKLSNIDFKTEAEARATILIYLLENNLTTAEEVNKRLAA